VGEDAHNEDLEAKNSPKKKPKEKFEFGEDKKEWEGVEWEGV